jgi:hypothetical protein
MNRHRQIAAAIAALASLAVASNAFADSRFFTARTDRPDVTIDQAFVNGQPLVLSGKGGGVSFFRIENPNGAVSCGGHFLFMASNGQRIQGDYDLCAVNWELTLPSHVSWAPFHKPGTGPGPQPDTMPGSNQRTVTIATDNPSIGITGVFIDKTPATILGRAGNSVAVAVSPGPGGIACQRDMGLSLTDGRVVAHRVNICANNWSVLFPIGGGFVPTPPPVAVVPPPPPPPPSEPQEQWTFTGGPNLSLIFGMPETDSTEFEASCRPGSGQAAVTLSRPVPGLRQGRPIQVTLSSGPFTDTYDAVGSPYSDISGGSSPQFTVGAGDPLWTALISGSQLIVNPGRASAYVVSLSGSSAPTRQFIASCAPAPVVVRPSPGARLDYLCDDGSEFSIVFNKVDGTALISEPGRMTQMLPRIPSLPDRDVWASGPFRLVGKDENITWSTPGRPPRTCGLN